MDVTQWIKDDKLRVFIKPKAKATEIQSYNQEKQALVIAVKAVPEKGAANKELVKFLTKLLKKRVMIKSGLTSKSKILLIK